MRGSIMAKLSIKGGNVLEGKIGVHGAKNSALPILAATVLTGGECVINNCPRLSDIEATLKILKYLGCSADFTDNTVVVSADNLCRFDIPKPLMCEMRSSVIFLGAILAKTGKAVISNPGGCDLGPRPINYHLQAMKSLGATVITENDNIVCTAPNGLHGANILLPFPSVGATENAILAATLARGKTVIHNAAVEPEIADLAEFLNKCGADINCVGRRKIIINGKKKLGSAAHSVIPDRIVACTYLSAVAATCGKAEIYNTAPEDFKSFLRFLKKTGCDVKAKNNSVYITSPKRLRPIKKITTGVHPLFPTDAGPLAVALLSLAKGKSEFYETVFDNRFNFIPELNNMNCDISVIGNKAIITGKEHINAADVYCTDLRAGAALVIAALAAEDESHIEGISFIDRGYEKLEENLSLLGADIKRI